MKYIVQFDSQSKISIVQGSEFTSEVRVFDSCMKYVPCLSGSVLFKSSAGTSSVPFTPINSTLSNRGIFSIVVSTSVSSLLAEGTTDIVIIFTTTLNTTEYSVLKNGLSVETRPFS